MKYLKHLIDLILAGYLLLLAAVLAPPLLGIGVYAVVSGSMAPQIPAGSAVYVKKTAFENICVGDAITYSLGDGSLKVTHRVTDINAAQKAFLTKGDANEETDGKMVPFSDVVGTVCFSLPYLGYLTILLGGAAEKMILMGLLLWLLLIKGIAENMLKIQEKEVRAV